MNSKPKSHENPQGISSQNVWQGAFAYVAVTIFLVICFALIQQCSWKGSAELHTNMEIVATMLAAFVGITSLIRFYAKKRVTYLFIGVGFLGTALLDGYHSIVTSQLLPYIMPSPPPSLIPWSWNASRTFLALLSFSSWIVWYRESRAGSTSRIHERWVYLFVGSLTIASFCFFAFVPLPRAYYPELFFGRPEEFVAGALFLLAFLGFLYRGEWRVDSFDFWMTMSLLVGFITQSLVMSRSFTLFDANFDFAHLLKIFAYVLVLTGLFTNMFNQFSLAETGKARLKAILKSTKDGILTFYSDGTIELANPAAEEMFGYQHRELAGMNIQTVIADAQFDKEGFFQVSGVVSLDNSTWEAQGLTKIGIRFPIELSASEVDYEGQRLFTCVVRDISERKLAEQEKETMQQHIAVASRYAGMAEVATGVLHNVGNVLNSITISANLIEKNVRQGSVDRLCKLSKLIESGQRQLDEPKTESRTTSCSTYLIKVAEALADERAAIEEEVLQLNRSINHVREIVAAQQSTARSGSALRPVDLQELVRCSLATIRGSFESDQIQINRIFTPTPKIISDEHKILQILINVLKNAQEAMLECDLEKRCITITIEPGESHAVVQIADTGPGISKDNLAQIFQHGFTTKEQGHGFGLHSCANAARELGGELTVDSDGEWQGATFTLSVPYEANTNASSKTEGHKTAMPAVPAVDWPSTVTPSQTF